jgi:hypothetical protein
MSTRIIVSLLAVGGLLPAAASAQQLQSIVPEVAVYQADAGSINQIKLVGCDDQGCCDGGDCCDSSACCVPAPCTDAGCYFGVDVVSAKPYFTDGIGPGDSDYSFELAPRFILGYRNSKGAGLRARYWFYSNESSVANGTGSMSAGDQTKLRLDVFDVEMTTEMTWGPVESVLFGGVRYADINHRQIAGGSELSQSDGWGPTLGFDTLTPLSKKTALVANVRYSVLFGDAYASESGDELNDKGFSSIETQLGVQRQRQTNFGALRLSGLIETQQWLAANDIPNDLGSVPHEDVFLLGFAFRVELAR